MIGLELAQLNKFLIYPSSYPTICFPLGRAIAADVDVSVPEPPVGS